MKAQIREIIMIAAALLFVISGVSLPMTGMTGITNLPAKLTATITYKSSTLAGNTNKLNPARITAKDMSTKRFAIIFYSDFWF